MERRYDTGTSTMIQLRVQAHAHARIFAWLLGTCIPELIEELWVALYERKYIDVKDVELVQLWLNSLIDIGFEFPTLEKMPAADEQNSQDNLLHQENEIISPSSLHLTTRD